MQKLLIFSDMDGTIDKAKIIDFVNLFNLIGKYCEKKGYSEFSFNIVTGAWDNCRDLYTDIFLEVQRIIGQKFDFSIFTRLHFCYSLTISVFSETLDAPNFPHFLVIYFFVFPLTFVTFYVCSKFMAIPL